MARDVRHDGASAVSACPCGASSDARAARRQDRGDGKCHALRGTNNRPAYSAARGAQVSYVRSVGLELAPYNVHINLMAQFFVENPTSVPGGKLADLASRLPEVPAGRFAKGRESALFALYLAGPESDFFVGQTVPFAGGWIA
ncbi:MAG: SDR family oxidoreductase [Dongiaceae bacterium]